MYYHTPGTLRSPSCRPFLPLLAALLLPGCVELTPDHPFDPETPPAELARGELALRLSLVAGEAVRPAERSLTVEALLVHVQAGPGAAPIRKTTTLAELEQGPVVLPFAGLQPGTERYPASYRLTVSDPLGLFVPLSVAEHRLELRDPLRWTEALTLRRQQLAIAGRVGLPGTTGVTARVALYPRDDGAACAVLPTGQPAGEVESGAGGEFSFPAVPRLEYGYCLVVRADGFVPAAQVVNVTAGTRPVSELFSLFLSFELTRFDAPLRLWNLDTLDRCHREPASCPLEQEGAGDAWTRYRLIFVELRPDSRLPEEIRNNGGAAGLSLDEHAAGPPPTTMFCAGPAAGDCEYGGGQTDGTGALWRWLTRYPLTAASVNTFCPPAPGEDWPSVSLPGAEPTEEQLSAPDGGMAEAVDGGDPAESDGGQRRGSDAGLPPRTVANLAAALEEVTSRQRRVFAYCLSQPGDGPKNLRGWVRARTGLSQPVALTIRLDQEPPTPPVLRMVRRAGDPDLEGAWLGDALYLRRRQVLLEVTASDRQLPTESLVAYWQLLPPADHLQECVFQEPRSIPRFGQVPVELNCREHEEEIARGCPECEGYFYRLRVLVEDLAGNRNERVLPIVFDLAEPDVADPVLSRPEQETCPSLELPEPQPDSPCAFDTFVLQKNRRLAPAGNAVLKLPASNEDEQLGAAWFSYAWDTAAANLPAWSQSYPRGGANLPIPLGLLTSGPHSLRVWIGDRAGHVKPVETEPLIIDAASPLATGAGWLTSSWEGPWQCPAEEQDPAPLPDHLVRGDLLFAGPGSGKAQFRILGQLVQAGEQRPCVRVTTRSRSRTEVLSEQILPLDPENGCLSYTHPAMNEQLEDDRENGIEDDREIDLTVLDQACNPTSLPAALRVRYDQRKPQGYASLEVHEVLAGQPPVNPIAIQAQLFTDRNHRSYFVAGSNFGYQLGFTLAPESEGSLRTEVQLFPQLEWGDDPDAAASPATRLGRQAAGVTCPVCVEGLAACDHLPYGEGDSWGCSLRIHRDLPRAPDPEQRTRLSVKVIDPAGNFDHFNVSLVNGQPVGGLYLDVTPPSPVTIQAWTAADPQQPATRDRLTWSGGADCNPARFEIEGWNRPAGQLICRAVADLSQFDGHFSFLRPCAAWTSEPARCATTPAQPCPQVLENPPRRDCYRVKAVDLAGNVALSPPFARPSGPR